MTAPVVLAVDQGTTNTKVVAVDETGRIVARHSERVDIAFPRPGWVESDAEQIWHTVQSSTERVVDQLGGRAIAAVGVSNQRETVVAWDPTTGRVLGPAVSWQCTRGAEFCRSITTPEAAQLVRATTGLLLDPMFSASKMRWLLDHVPDGRERATDGRLAIGTVDAWLAWNLSGGSLLATDLTNASRTALCDIRTEQWSDALLDLFGIPAEVLPAIHSSSHRFAECRSASVSGVPVASLIGDSHAALVGHGAFEPGAVKASFGTGTSVMAPVPEVGVDPAGLALTVGWSADLDGDRRVVHAVEGNIYATGAALEWTADLLDVDVGELDRVAGSCADSGGVTFVPAFSGLGAPHWDPTARGTLLGLTRGSGRAEVARATFEAVAHQVADVVDAVAVASTVPTALFVDGGAMQSDRLAALVADLTGVTVRRSDAADVAAIGAALLAGLNVGTWSSIDELEQLDRSTRDVRPAIDADERTGQRERWARSVRRSAGWETS